MKKTKVGEIVLSIAICLATSTGVVAGAEPQNAVQPQPDIPQDLALQVMTVLTLDWKATDDQFRVRTYALSGYLFDNKEQFLSKPGDTLRAAISDPKITSVGLGEAMISQASGGGGPRQQCQAQYYNSMNACQNAARACREGPYDRRDCEKALSGCMMRALSEMMGCMNRVCPIVLNAYDYVCKQPNQLNCPPGIEGTFSVETGAAWGHRNIIVTVILERRDSNYQGVGVELYSEAGGNLLAAYPAFVCNTKQWSTDSQSVRVAIPYRGPRPPDTMMFHYKIDMNCEQPQILGNAYDWRLIFSCAQQ